jgi:hypothetical protein
MLYEKDALGDLLETLNSETKYQLRYLIKAFEEEETFGMPGQAVKKWEKEQTLRKILRTAGEFFCRGRELSYCFKNEYVAGVKREAAKTGFSLKRKIYQLNSYFNGSRRNTETTCWLLESGDGKIEFYEDEKSEAVKILFFVTADGGAFFQLKRLVTAARKLLLVEDKKMLYGTVLEKESDIYPFESKKLLERNLEGMSDGLSRLHHVYLKLGAETIGPKIIASHRK